MRQFKSTIDFKLAQSQDSANRFSPEDFLDLAHFQKTSLIFVLNTPSAYFTVVSGMLFRYSLVGVESKIEY